MRKGNKADYVVAMKSELGDSWVEEDHLPPTDGNVLLVEAMAFVHRQQDTGCKKFLNMATRISCHIEEPGCSPPGCNKVNLVGDRYGL